MTDADLARLRELLAAATPGPWQAVRKDKDSDNPAEWELYEFCEDDPPLATVHMIATEDTAELIALLRNCAPALLERLERAEAACEALRAERDGRLATSERWVARMNDLRDRYALASNVCEALDQDRDGFTIELECDGPARAKPCGTCPMCRVNKAHAAWRADGRKEASAPPAKGETE